MCSIHNVHDLLEDGETFVLLTKQLNLSQLAEVEVSFCLETLD